MEANRIELSDLLESIMVECGETPHLYYQAPESVKMEYPCFIYRLKAMPVQYADDRPYKRNVGFDVTYITRSPTSKVPSRMLEEPTFSFDRYYPAENLHHYAYTTISSLKEVTT